MIEDRSEICLCGHTYMDHNGRHGECDGDLDHCPCKQFEWAGEDDDK